MFAPTTQVRFLHGVECDPTNANVRDFANVSAQTAYFEGKIKYRYDTCRVMDVVGYAGYVIAPIGSGNPMYPGTTIDSYYDCNYIMYRNTEISGKWFYAYLGTPEPYVSGAVRIPYTIDVWQTWQFDVSFGQCLIARQTVLDDTVGRWLLPENIEAGEYYCIDQQKSNTPPKVGYDILAESGFDTSPCLLIVYSYAPASGDTSDYYVDEIVNGLKYKFSGMRPEFSGGYIESGLYQGARYAWVDLKIQEVGTEYAAVVAKINGWISDLVGQGQIDKIMALRIVPKGFFRTAEFSGDWTVSPANSKFPLDLDATMQGSPTTFGAYVPKNNKLYTQQYNYSVIDNGAGSQSEFGYEYFAGAPKAKIYAQLSENPVLSLVPVGYKAQANAQSPMYTMQIDSYPTSSYSYSAAANSNNANRWGNAVGAVRNVYGAITDTVSKFASGDVVGGAMSIASGALDVAGEVASYHDKARIPNTVSGQAHACINYALGRLSFVQYRMQISPEYARKVDDYFAAYGYRIDEFGVPQTRGRKCWNYVQCIDPVVNGNAPYEVRRQIAAMLSAGLRVWHSGANWMDYSQDNTIGG